MCYRAAERAARVVHGAEIQFFPDQNSTELKMIASHVSVSS
jgi:hypothetical protein